MHYPLEKMDRDSNLGKAIDQMTARYSPSSRLAPVISWKLRATRESLGAPLQMHFRLF